MNLSDSDHSAHLRMIAMPHIFSTEKGRIDVQRPAGGNVNDLIRSIGVVEDYGRVTGRDIESELGLPKYFEEWELMAKPRGYSSRHIQFIIADELPTQFPGRYRFQPQRITLPNTCHLGFGHHGFVVGTVHPFLLGFDELRELVAAMFDFEIPKEMQGDYLIGQATLFHSPLADKAWDGLRLGIFTHVCPLVLRKVDEPVGTGQLVEVSLRTADYPGCSGAKIIKMWDA